MKEFDVTITETLKLTVSVEASSKEEAQQMCFPLRKNFRSGSGYFTSNPNGQQICP